jgi:hypothetical protein
MRGPAGSGVVVTQIGDAAGAREIAAAVACIGSDVDRAGLLVELTAGERSPRPALVATAAARALEDRLSAHLPGVPVAARGRHCHLSTSVEDRGVEVARAARPLVRDSACVVLAAPGAVTELLDGGGIAVDSALVRADLGTDRALTALAVRGLLARGLRVAVAKRALPWAAARMALFGALPRGADAGVPRRTLERCLGC